MRGRREGGKGRKMRCSERVDQSDAEAGEGRRLLALHLRLIASSAARRCTASRPPSSAEGWVLGVCVCVGVECYACGCLNARGGCWEQRRHVKMRGRGGGWMVRERGG